MARIEDLIITHAVNADYELGDALIKVGSIQEEGKLDDHDLGRVADLYHLRGWWQQVTDLTHGGEETVDGELALLTIRECAERYLVRLPARTGRLSPWRWMNPAGPPPRRFCARPARSLMR